MNERTSIRFIRQDILQDDKIRNMIYFIRGKYVMLDEELAAIYDVELKRMNEQVKRNSLRFPNGFRFQVTEKEYKALRSQIATLNSENRRRGQHRKYLPYAFTEQGVDLVFRQETGSADKYLYRVVRCVSDTSYLINEVEV